ETRLDGSVLDRERAASASISSSVIANSTACRHPAMKPLLVAPPQPRNPPTLNQFQRRLLGIDRLVLSPGL
ncbi:hypothetical protein, partial [Bradyrhizobium yuanmingense]|uniref:hypothetical protein n=1 Tax=Bradyrhizobium yuanmingense TaxID=108015 RepID=UPI001AED7B32